MSEEENNIIDTVSNAIKNKIDSEIEIHDGDNEAHDDIRELINNKANTSSLATVAITGDYDDLDNKPQIPSDLSNYITKSQTTGLVKNDGSIDENTYVTTSDSRLSDARTPTSHTHTKSQISDFPSSMTPSSHTHGNLQNDGKIKISGTAQASKNVVTDANGNITAENKPTIPTGSSTATDIKMNGTQSAGSSSNFAKADHVHPVDTSRAASNHNHDGTYLKSYTPPTGSTSQAGIVQLEDSYSSTSTTKAATPNAVKAAYDKANHSHPYLTSSDISGKEDKSNIVTSTAGWSSTTSDTKYPSEKLVKNSLDGKADSGHNHDGTYLKSYTPPSASTSQAGIVQLSTSTSGTSTSKAATESAVKAAYDKGNHSHPYASSTHSHSQYTVTVEKQTTAETGYIATYVVKQNGSQVGEKINIPKDYLVKSANMGTVSTANSPVSGYAIGDKYIDFVINTKDNSGTDEHIYINVKDLFNVYTAGTGLTLSNGAFSLTDASNYVKKSSTSGYIKNDGSIGTPTNTTYANGTGITIGTGNAINHSNSVTALTTAGLKKVKYDAQGHITGTSDVVKGDITALGIPSSDTTYSTATQSANGLMSSTDKTKLDGIATAANNYTHPTTHDASIIKDSTAHSNIGSSANDTQATINTKIDTALSGKQAAGSYATSDHNHDGLYLKTHQDISGKIDTAGTGLSKSGTTLNHSNSITALTTASLKKIKYDAQGHITGTANVEASDLPSHTHDYSPSNHSHSADNLHYETNSNNSIKEVLDSKIDTAGTGLSKSGNTLNHSNSVTAQTTAAFKKITYDAQGHITGTDDVTASDLPSHTHSDGYSFSFLVGDNSNGISLTKINGIAIITMNNYGKNYSTTMWQTIVSTGLTNRTGQNIYASNGERRFRITSSGNLQMNIETAGTVYTGWAQIIFPYS